MRADLAGLLLVAGVAAAPARAQVSGYEVVLTYSDYDSSAVKAVDVLCPAGKSVLGGGGGSAFAVTDTFALTLNRVLDLGSGSAVGWSAEAREVEADPNNWRLAANAICGQVPGLERVGDATPSDSYYYKSLSIPCPSGKTAIGGGFEVAGTSDGVTVYESYPELDATSGQPIGWSLGATETIPTDGAWILRGEVLCAELDVLVSEVISVGFETETHNPSLYLLCPESYVPLGGGVSGSGWLRSSEPNSTYGLGWLAETSSLAGATATGSMFAAVICPEPEASLLGVAALAAVLAARRRRPGPALLARS